MQYGKERKIRKIGSMSQLRNDKYITKYLIVSLADELAQISYVDYRESRDSPIAHIRSPSQGDRRSLEIMVYLCILSFTRRSFL